MVRGFGKPSLSVSFVRVQCSAAMVGSALLASQTGCANDSAARESPKAAAVSPSLPIPDPLATVDGDKIALADVRERVGTQLDQLEVQYRRARDRLLSTALDSLLRDRLITAETKKTGKSYEQLLSAEMSGNAEPSEVEIKAWFDDNQARLGGRSLDQVRSQIADFLRKQRRDEAVNKLDRRLTTDHKVAIAYQPYRLEFSNEGAPTLGKKDAPVTLVEFSDFQCPYCRASAPTLKQVAKAFGDKVQIVYRQYPIPSLHPFAFKAAEASLCAQDQGKFWELHDAMFEDQGKLAVSDLKQTARRLGLDGKKFDSCLDSGRYVEQVQNDQKEGERVGVTGTPAMFINGRIVDGGSVPFTVLEGLIQKELVRSAVPKS